VSLPAGQQQVLDRIETDLEGCEPRLRSMFAIFTRLTRDEGAPRTESLLPQGRLRTWLTDIPRAVIWVPLVLGLATVFLFLAINNSAAPGCGAAEGAHAPAADRAVGCQSVLESSGRP
jgi:hypothetical protein